MKPTRSSAKRGVFALALAGGLLLASAAHAGFPVVDLAAFAQRVETAITENSQLAALGTLITNTTAMMTTLDDTIDQALRHAEGRISPLGNWPSLFSGSAANSLGAAAEVQDWVTRLGQVRTRANRVATGALGALPAEADIRGAWQAALAPPPIGTPALPPPAESREALAARHAQELAPVLQRQDELLAARGDLVERHAQLLEDMRGRLDDLASDTAISEAALQQKAVSAGTAAADLLAAQGQLALLREELAVQERTSQREALAAHSEAVVDGIRAGFDGAAQHLRGYNAQAADRAAVTAVMPAY